jgi:hypothetical protein
MKQTARGRKLKAGLSIIQSRHMDGSITRNEQLLACILGWWIHELRNLISSRSAVSNSCIEANVTNHAMHTYMTPIVSGRNKFVLTGYFSVILCILDSGSEFFFNLS